MVKIIFLLLFIGFSCSALPIDNIKIIGNERIEKETVLEYLDVKIGSNADDFVVSQAIKKLFATKFFADVSVALNGNELIINVVENPIISRVEFSGVKKDIAKGLKAEIKTKNRGIYSKDNIKFDSEAIKSFFIKSGSLDTTVIPRIRILDGNKIEVFFDINEGNTVKVDKVMFVGNKHFFDIELISKINLRGVVWWDLFLNDNKYDEAKIEADKMSISNSYLNSGYADFKFNSVIAEYDKESTSFILTYFISEGEIYHFDDSNIESITDIVSTETIPRSLINHKKGDLYNHSKIKATIDGISLFLNNLGFINPVVTPVINKKDKIASVSYVIDKTNAFYISKVEISGNSKTHDNVIRREMLIAEGDIYRKESIELSKRKLLMLDYFDSVEIKEKIVDSKSVELTIEIVEKTRADGININAGYTTFGGLLYGFGVSRKNLFGRGYNGSFQFQQSIFMSQYSFSFINPRIFNSDVSLGFDFNYMTFGSAIAGFPFNNTTISSGITVGYLIAENLSQSWGIRVQHDNLMINKNIGSQIYASMANSAISDILVHTLTYDRRNHPMLPTKGILTSLTTSLSGYIGIGGQKFISNDLLFAVYTPTINEDFVLTIGFQGGHIVGLENQNVLFQNRYSVGYQNFRGFYYMGVGPRVEIDNNGSTSYFYGSLRSTTYAIGTVELTIPLPIPKDYMIRLYAFSDFGTAFGYQGIMNYTNENGVVERVINNPVFRLSAGVGVMWVSPIGPIKIDIAQPILYAPYDQLQMFRIMFSPGPF